MAAMDSHDNDSQRLFVGTKQESASQSSRKPEIFSAKKANEEREERKKKKPLYIIKKRFFKKKEKVKGDLDDHDSPEQSESLLENQNSQIREVETTSISKTNGCGETVHNVEEIEPKYPPAIIQQQTSPDQLEVNAIHHMPDVSLPIELQDITRPVEGKSIPIYVGNQPFMHNLKNILEKKDVMDLPVFVLALAGEYRTGKSFLLSYILRKLLNQDTDDWLGDPDEPLYGFDHKYDDKCVTKGINIWNQPIIIGKNDEKVLVLLMDCQGIFSAKEEEESTRIFALSTMVSSVLVFNLMNQLSESVLNYLKLFTAYAKVASSKENNRTPFQKLFLLIRDWGKKHIKPFGSEGGKLLLNEYFQGNRDFLKDTFSDIDSYLMPNPGMIVEEEDYDGSLRELREDFKQHLKSLPELLLDPKHIRLNLKEVTGQKITAKDFCKYFEECTKLLENVNWKEIQNLMEMHTRFNCELAKGGAIKEYKSNMDNRINSVSTLMTEIELDLANENSAEEARKKFDEMNCFTQNNNKEMAFDTKNILEQELIKEFKIYKSTWKTQLDNKRLREEARKSQSMCASFPGNCRKVTKYGGATIIGGGLGATAGAVGEVVAVSALTVSAASGVGAAVGASAVVVGVLAKYTYKKYKKNNPH